ncbi:cytochrome P450 [Nitzschia inconspicua]|uniref:Cytochrome P450 n=1 Tax=Nitzschia inconspicua TaxID=303405 RepID=A0A9K3L385_9STRA|nr:cytochrome P450 [Nitzschia inconspicua]
MSDVVAPPNLFSGLGPSIAAAVAVVVVTVIIAGKIFRRDGENGKPYPPFAPASMLDTMNKMQGSDLPWFYLQMATTLGNRYTYRLKLPLRRMFVVTGDPNFARDVLLDPKSTKPDLYRQFEAEGIGNIFTRNGEFWHARRKGTAPAFSSSHIKRMNSVAIEIAELWIKNTLLPVMKEGRPFDVAKEMISITLDSICKTAFEYDPTEEEKEQFLKCEELVTTEYISRSLSNPFRQYLGPLLPRRREAMQAAKSNLALAKRIIANYRAMKNPTKGTIVDLIANNKCYANLDEMAVDLIIYLVAGHDTTGYTLAFTLLELARHPEEQKKIRDDLAKRTPDDWSNSKVVQMAIKESMRLYPVSAGGSLRQLGRDFETDDGFVVPRNSNVVAAMILLHRNSTVFEDADKFIPSRWENPTKEMKDAFLIFSAGKQNCIGQALANAELQCIIPMILSQVELEVMEEGSVDCFLTMKPTGAWLKAKPLKGN